ncbi:MAG: CHAD domain-containing protein [bacterium]
MPAQLAPTPPPTDSTRPHAALPLKDLRDRARTFLALSSEVLAYGQPEGVHDLRVASRRLREALEISRPLLDENFVGNFQSFAKKTAKSLNKARDCEVALDFYEKSLTGKKGDERLAVRFLIEHCRQQRQEALQEAARIFDLERQREYEQQIGDGGFPSHPSQPPSVESASRDPEAIAKPLLRRLKRLSALWPKALRRKKTGARHRARIQVKKLRYSMEGAGLATQKTRQRVFKTLVNLQETLGDLNDITLRRTEVKSLLRDEFVASQPQLHRGLKLFSQRLARGVNRKFEAFRKIASSVDFAQWRRALKP